MRIENQVVSPLTETPNITLLSEFRSKKLISDWQASFGIDISDELTTIEKISLFRCNETGLMFYYPLEAAGSSSLYEHLQKFDWFYMTDKWEYQVALDDLRNCHEVLEVGAATGHFVKSVISKGIHIKGIELNKKAVFAGKEEGLPIDCLSLEDVIRRDGKDFDAVCSFQVLEHVSDPKNFIEQCVNTVKENGQIIFSVPNADSFLKYQYNLLDMPPHHMTRWTEKTFKSLENLFPIRLEKVLFEPLAEYHVQGYLEAYSNHFRNSRWYGRLVFNRFTLPVFEKVIAIEKVRCHFKGQSLYVQFRNLA